MGRSVDACMARYEQRDARYAPPFRRPAPTLLRFHASTRSLVLGGSGRVGCAHRLCDLSPQRHRGRGGGAWRDTNNETRDTLRRPAGPLLRFYAPTLPRAQRFPPCGYQRGRLAFAPPSPEEVPDTVAFFHTVDCGMTIRYTNGDWANHSV